MSGTHAHSHLWPGVPLALGSALLFGAGAPLSKILLNNINPFLLAGLLYLGAGLGLAIYHLALKLFGAVESEAHLARSDIPWLISAVVTGGMIGPVLLLFGLSKMDASSGALLLNLEALATMGIAWLIFRENADPRLLAGAAAILAGAVILTWSGQGLVLNNGAMFIAAACLAWGVDNNLTRNISATNPVIIAMTKGLVAGSVNLVIAMTLGAEVPDLYFLGFAAIVGFLSVGVSLVFFILALRHLGTARTGAYFSLAPFIGAIFAILLLGEPVTAKLLTAAFLMGVGLWVHISERHAHDHAHDYLEHEHSHVHDEHHRHTHDSPVVSEPHSHMHKHMPTRHRHVHYPDLHHRHGH